ncbi:MAG: hypothetical protein ACRC5M_04340 [Anaeroplasmataceae bacterium]
MKKDSSEILKDKLINKKDTMDNGTLLFNFNKAKPIAIHEDQLFKNQILKESLDEEGNVVYLRDSEYINKPERVADLSGDVEKEFAVRLDSGTLAVPIANIYKYENRPDPVFKIPEDVEDADIIIEDRIDVESRGYEFHNIYLRQFDTDLRFIPIVKEHNGYLRYTLTDRMSKIEFKFTSAIPVENAVKVLLDGKEIYKGNVTEADEVIDFAFTTVPSRHTIEIQLAATIENEVKIVNDHVRICKPNKLFDVQNYVSFINNIKSIISNTRDIEEVNGQKVMYKETKRFDISNITKIQFNTNILSTLNEAGVRVYPIYALKAFIDGREVDIVSSPGQCDLHIFDIQEGEKTLDLIYYVLEKNDFTADFENAFKLFDIISISPVFKESVTRESQTFMIKEREDITEDRLNIFYDYSTRTDKHMMGKIGSSFFTYDKIVCSDIEFLICNPEHRDITVAIHLDGKFYDSVHIGQVSEYNLFMELFPAEYKIEVELQFEETLETLIIRRPFVEIQRASVHYRPNFENYIEVDHFKNLTK